MKHDEVQQNHILDMVLKNKEKYDYKEHPDGSISFELLGAEYKYKPYQT